MLKKCLAVVLLLTLIFVMFTGCQSVTIDDENADKVITEKNITVVLDWTPNTNHTGIYAAKELDYYKEVGLDVDIIQPPEDNTLLMVAAGNAQFGISFQEEVLIAANEENNPLPITAIAAILENNTSGLLSLKEKNITRFKDMEGKSFGSWGIPVFDELLKECVRLDGGDPEKVEFVPNNATDTLSGIRNDFDAAWVYEGWDKIIADINEFETNYLPFADMNPVFNYYTPVIVMNSNRLKAAPEEQEMAEKFLQATKKGYEYAKTSPKEAADILLKYSPEVGKDIIHASQEFISTQYYSGTWGNIDPKRWNDFFDWMKNNGIIHPESKNTAFENGLIK